MNDRVKALLGICMKAGFIKAGETAAEKALRDGSARLVLISEDASENTKKKFVNKAFYYNIPAKIYGSRDDMNNAIGRQNRVTLAITDKNLSGLIVEAINVKQETEVAYAKGSSLPSSEEAGR